MIGDSKEQIEQCLNCTKLECNNCLRTSERKASLVDQHKEQVKELYERGLSDRQIAKRLHCGHNTVGACRRALGLPPLKERALGRAAGV